MRKAVIGTVMTIGLAVTGSAPALPSYAEAFVGAGHMVDVWQTAGSPTEVHLWSYSARQLDPALDPSPFAEGCVELFLVNVYEIACGLTLSDTSSLAQARAAAVMPSEVYDYDQDTGFTYREAGEITVALTFTGEGTPRLAEPPNGVGVCGLPPDIPTGGGILAGVPIERPVSIAGTLASDALGPIELAPLFGTITQSTFAYAWACL